MRIPFAWSLRRSGRRSRRVPHPHRRRDRFGRFEIAPGRVALTLAVVVFLAFLLCIHLWPNRVALHLGDIADREIVAQRTVRYEDTEATRLRRSEAAAQVDKRYEPLPDAALAAAESVRAIFDALETAPRRNGSASSQPALVERMVTDIQRQSGVRLETSVIAPLLGLNPSMRQEARAVAVRLVEAAMADILRDDTDDLADTRRQLTRDPLLKGFSEVRLRRALAAASGAVLTPNVRYDERETARARLAAESAVPVQMRRITAGAPILRSGERVTQQHLDAFTALGLRNAAIDGPTVAAITAFVALLVWFVAVYLRLFHRSLYEHTPGLVLLALLTVISVVGLKIGSTLLGLPISGVQFGYLAVMCVASAGMVISLLLSPGVATLVVALLAVISGLVLNNELRFTVITLAASLVGIASVATLRNRGDLMRAAILLCTATALVNGLVGHLSGDRPNELLSGILWGVVSGLFALVLFWLGVIVFERPFGITTHLRLLELADPATPILQEFRMTVPGTYAHSLMVGNLAHTAAEAIGADALLVRVAAYYHDLGKMRRPEFFIENQSNAENVHDRLNPSLSAIILASHVKEGLELAESVGLPPRVREVIQQHHGTSLMKFFYHRATGGVGDPSLEAQFRYPGPKPRSKEAAILMLADSVEAASRTLERPTPQRVADFVARMIEDKRSDGQLDDCELTLRDIKRVEDVFVRTLCGALHARVEYPNSPTALPSEPTLIASETTHGMDSDASGEPASPRVGVGQGGRGKVSRRGRSA